MRRWLLCGVAIIGMGVQANAADMPDFLRGSSTVMAGPAPNGGGFYVGGHVGGGFHGSFHSGGTSVHVGGSAHVGVHYSRGYGYRGGCWRRGVVETPYGPRYRRYWVC